MFAVASPIYVSNSHTKFGWISSNCLGGDSIMDGWIDRRTYGIANNIFFVFFKKSMGIIIEMFWNVKKVLTCFHAFVLYYKGHDMTKHVFEVSYKAILSYRD